MCETDLFSLLKCTQDKKIIKAEKDREKLFKDVLYDDIMNVHLCLKAASEEIHDPIFKKGPHNEMEIRNLFNFLGVQKFKRKQQKTLHFTEDFNMTDNSWQIKSVFGAAV